MSWNGEQFGRPLVMVQREDVRTLRTLRGYKPEDEIMALFPIEQISGELALPILLHHGKVEDAVNLLACAIVPRVGIWWCWRCLQLVFKDIAEDEAKDGLTPPERREKEIKELAERLSDTSDIDAMVEDQKKLIDDKVRELEEEARRQGYLNPVERVQLKLQMINREFDELKGSLPPGSLGEEDEPGLMSELVNQLKKSAANDFEQMMRRMEPEGKAEEMPSVPSSQRIFDAIRQKTEAVKPAIDREMAKYFPLKLRGLPPKASQAKKDAAAAAALRWLLAPTDDNGRLACEAAIEAQSGPESMLAYAAFWSSTNLKTETGLAPTNPALPPMGISKTLLQLALMEGGEMDYDARYEEFLRIGIECADGTSTWDEHGNEVRTEEKPASSVPRDDVFGRRSGFGRD